MPHVVLPGGWSPWYIRHTHSSVLGLEVARQRESGCAMSLTETILFLFIGVHNGVIVYLCLERDRMFEKIKELESK